MVRFEKQENLLRLCLQMQATAEGVSLDDICQTYEVSRRTAERMRDAVIRLFPQTEERRLDGRQKSWRLPPSTLGRMNDPTLDDLAALNRSIETSRSTGDKITAKKLELLLEKLQANLNSKMRTRLEPDLAALFEADYVALRPGPRERLNEAHLAIIKNSVLAGTTLRVTYRKRSTGKLKHGVKLGPLGVLLGNGRQYLVALDLESGVVKHYALYNIQDISGGSEYFEKPEDFDLSDFAAKGFGLFHEDEYDVEWLFCPEIKALASNYLFHPNQIMEENEDGSLTVKFRSGGLREMCWHLFQWGSFVEIVSPEELIEEYEEQLEDAWEALGYGEA